MDFDLEAMTVDALIDYKLSLKRQIQSLQAVYNTVHDVYAKKVNFERIQDRIKAAGLEGVVAVPEPGEVKTDSIPVKVS